MLKRSLSSLVACVALSASSAGPVGAVDNLMERFGPIVKWYHLYSASDGFSHIEEMAVPTSMGPNGMTTLFDRAARRVAIGYWPDGFQSDWHYATNQNVLIYLQGTQIIETGDGKQYPLPPGVAVLADDWTGKGHTYRCDAKKAPNNVCLVIQITLGDLEKRLPLPPPPAR